MPPPDRSWTETTRFIVDRWKLCAKMELDWVENPKGCAALATVVGNMARIIDDEIDRRDSGLSLWEIVCDPTSHPH